MTHWRNCFAAGLLLVKMTAYTPDSHVLRGLSDDDFDLIEIVIFSSSSSLFETSVTFPISNTSQISFN